ncbi:MAG: ABC transporter permease subunit [Minisyncoccia bacterium]
MSTLDIILNYYPALLRGLWVTLELFLSVSVIGIVCGVLFGSLGARVPQIGKTIKIVSFLVAAIPLLVLLYWFYYPLQSLLHISIDPFLTALAVLAIVNIAAVAEVIRESLSEYPKQYVALGQMGGLSAAEITWHIQLPMIFRQTIPSLLTSQIYIVQATLFASLISVPEIFRVAQNINAMIYKPIQIYTALALFFVLILGPLNYLAHVLRQNLTRDLSER